MNQCVFIVHYGRCKTMTYSKDKLCSNHTPKYTGTPEEIRELILTKDMFLRSNLYQDFKEDGHDEDTLKDIFREETKKVDVVSLLINYKSILYTEENINDCVRFLSYLRYDIFFEFIDYIFRTYILERILLEYIGPDEGLCNAIRDFCKQGSVNYITDAFLNYIRSYVTIEELNLTYNRLVTDDGIREMPLKKLDLSFNVKITDDTIKGMLLEELDLRFNDIITDDSIREMPLKKLSLSMNSKITNDGIREMLLEELDLSYNTLITDDGIRRMQLEELDLRSNENITNDGIKGMPLIKLNLASNRRITNDGIKGMPLKILDLDYNERITDDGIKDMKLEHLSSKGNAKVTYEIENGVRKNK